MASGGDRGWCWGSLRPWQILHSRLAERENRGSMLDVWDLIDETMGAADPRYTDDGFSYMLYFLDDDEEFWRHGGIMEARIRDWLATRGSEMEESTATSRRMVEAAAAAEEEEEEEEAEEGSEDDDEDEDDDDKREVDTEAVISKCCKEVYSSSSSSSNSSSNNSNRSVVNGTIRSVVVAGEEQEEEDEHEEEDDEREDDDEQQELCPVCLEKFVPNQVLLSLPCSHKFHRGCLTPWIQRKHGCCPCCRADVITTATAAAASASASASASAAAPPLEPFSSAPHGSSARHVYHHRQSSSSSHATARSSYDNSSGRSYDYNSSSLHGGRHPSYDYNSNGCSYDYNSSSLNAGRHPNPSGDIMCVLADMEAALERFGFRS